MWQSCYCCGDLTAMEIRCVKNSPKNDHSIAICSIFIGHILGGTWWFLMSSRFRIWMAKGDRPEVAKSQAVTILTLEQNPPWVLYICKKFSQEDLALESKLWLPGFLLHRPLILLAIRVLTAFSNIGQAKHGQKGLPSNFCSKEVCSPMYSHHFTFYDPSPIACRNKNVTQVPVTYHWSVF